MTEDPLADAAARYHAALKRHKAAIRAAQKAIEKRSGAAADLDREREELQRQVVEAGRAGRRPKDITAITRYTPERVRQLLRGAGIEPFEPATVTEP